MRIIELKTVRETNTKNKRKYLKKTKIYLKENRLSKFQKMELLLLKVLLKPSLKKGSNA